MRDLADCFIYLLRLLAAIKLIVETAAATTQVRQPRRKANDEPFFKIERLKKNLLHQLKRLTKRFKDFDIRFRTVHGAYSETVRPARSIPKTTRNTP